MTTTLDDLVRQLALPHEVAVTRHGRYIGHRQRRPLLAVLSDTATPSSGTTAGRSTAGPRIAFDPATTELYARIHQQIRQWARLAGVPRQRYFADGAPLDWSDATQVLLAWWANVTPDTAQFAVLELDDWTRTIYDLVIDPPKRIALDAACPRCHQRWAVFTHGARKGERVDALQITMRDPATDSETDCRNCGAHWTGLDGAEALREEWHRQDHISHLITCAGTTNTLTFEPWIQSAIDDSRTHLVAQQLQERVAS